MSATRKERYYFYNNLVCVIKSLEGQYTVIDLRNESAVTGRIKEVDAFWNVQMEDVIFYNPRGEEYSFDAFYINAKNIRFVHIPDGLSITNLIENKIFNLGYKPVVKKRPTIKKRRAEKYQKETVQSLAKENE